MRRWHFQHPEMQINKLFLALGSDNTAREDVEISWKGS